MFNVSEEKEKRRLLASLCDAAGRLAKKKGETRLQAALAKREGRARPLLDRARD